MTPRAVRRSESNKAKGMHTSACWQRLQSGKVYWLTASIELLARLTDGCAGNVQKKLFQLQPCETSNTGRQRIEKAGSIWSLQIRVVGSAALLIVKPTGSWIIEKCNPIIAAEKNSRIISRSNSGIFIPWDVCSNFFTWPIFLHLYSGDPNLLKLFCGFLPTSATIPQWYSTALNTDKQLHDKNHSRDEKGLSFTN